MVTREIYYSTDSALPLEEWSRVTASKADMEKIVSAVAAGTYYVKARDTEDGKTPSDFSTLHTVTVAASPTLIPLAAPTGLAAQSAVYHTVNLSWTDTNAGEAGYKVERKAAASGTWELMGTYPANTISAAVKGHQAETPYDFRVIALGDNVATSDSPAAQVSFTTGEFKFISVGDMIATLSNTHGIKVLDSASSFNVGEGDFTVTWRGALMSLPSTDARIVSKLSGTGGFSIATLNQKFAATLRMGGNNTAIPLQTNRAAIAGEMVDLAFRRNGVALGIGNLDPAAYSYWINGVNVPINPFTLDRANANLDNINNFYTGFAQTGSAPSLSNEITTFYKRALTDAEILDLSNQIFPKDATGIWMMRNEANSGITVADLSPNQNNAELIGFAAEFTDPATQIAYFRAATSLLFKNNATTLQKEMDAAYTFTRLIYGGTLRNNTSYRVLDAQGVERAAGLVTFDAGSRSMAFNHSVQKGWKLEFTMPSTSVTSVILSAV